MQSSRVTPFLTLVWLLFLLPAEASMVRKMDLAEMSRAAGVILRGVVVDIDKTTVTAGGGNIPAITYHVEVSEQLKGSVPVSAEGLRYSFTTVDLSAVDTPRLTVGQDYLLLLTAPSGAGLSTMVGLGQGAFKVYGAGNTEMAVNSVNNLGLATGLKGPVPYETLAARIRAAL